MYIRKSDYVRKRKFGNMKKGPIIGFLILTLIFSLISSNPILAEQTEKDVDEGIELIENGGFEEGRNPWVNYRDASIKVTDEEYSSGSHSLLIYDRQSTVDGPQQYITGKVKAGGVYKFSAKIKYDEGPEQKEFNFNIQNGPSWENIDVMGSATIKKGEWGILEGTYEIPENANLSENFIFIETSYANPPNPEIDLMDFYVDDVSFIDITPDPNLLENGGFEDGLEPWTNYGEAIVEVTDQESNNGSHSLLVKEREATTDGPKQDITGKVKAGGVYKFSAKVKYIDGPEQKGFNFNIRNGPSWENIKVMGSATIKKGEWGTIEGTYTIPEDADLSESFIFLETSFVDPADPETDLMDFYVDDVSFGEQLRTAPEDQGPGAIHEGTEAIAKIPGKNNPLVSHKFGADPNALVYNDRLYVYLTNDEYEYDANGDVVNNSYSGINTITVISSEDMVNWTDHGAIPVAGSKGAAKWATNSWAPAIGHKVIDGKDKFFLYFSNNGSGIGVLTADSPLGPWEDPIGKPLINGNTPGTEGVVWIFDPAVLIDDNGEGYLYYGGGVPGNPPTQEQAKHPKTARVIKLSEDMIHTEGEAQLIDAPFMFEASGIHKHNGKYYFSYSTNFSGSRGEGDPGYADISYMVSDNPMGPFDYEGVALRNGSQFFGVGGNNHHDFFQLNGQWYITYHAQTLGKALDTVQGYRSPHINKVEYDGDGKIKDIKADMDGVSQITTLNPYQRVEAETFAWQAGIATERSEAPGSMLESLNLNVTDINNGNWLAVSQADFGDSGAASFEANIASTEGGIIEIRIDSSDGEVIGTLEVNPTGGDQEWKLIETEVSHVSGVHDVYFMFVGKEEVNLFNLDYWQFIEVQEDKKPPIEEPTDPQPDPDNNQDNENDSEGENGQVDDNEEGEGEQVGEDSKEGENERVEDDGKEEEGDENSIEDKDSQNEKVEKEEQKISGDKELPSTATNLYRYLMLGMILLLIGSFSYLKSRKKLDI